MPYNSDLDPWGGGYDTADILGSTPGYAGPLQKGRDLVEQSRENIVVYKGLFDKKGTVVSPETYDAAKKQNPLAVIAGETLGLVRPESEARQKSGLEKWISRGIYLTLGVIFIIIGLIMLSQPAREGIAEGIAEGLRNA